MKDPNDKQTIDGFADLVTLIDEAEASAAAGVPLDDLRQLLDHVRSKIQPPAAPAGKKRGRKPAGERALTPAEKQKAYRLRQKLAKVEEQVRLAEIAAGLPVKSDIIDLDTSVADLYRKGDRK